MSLPQESNSNPMEKGSKSAGVGDDF